MKHGLKLRKLQRTPSHRYALLRNLVSALLHHESIKTTLPKAKETARMAEKIITLGKKGNDPARRAAMAFLMPSHSYNPSERPQGPIPPPRPSGYPSSSSASSSSSSPSSTPEDPETFEPPTTLLPKLFSTLSERYASRSGGYTRIHRFGRRPGDNAPHAILELVDGPKDLKFEMVSRAVGREAAVAGVSMESGGAAGRIEEMEGLREGTQLAVQKVLQFRGQDGEREMRQKAAEWANVLRAEEQAYNGHRRQKASLANKEWSEVARTPAPHEGRRYVAGERMSGMQIAHTGLGLARGALGRRQRLDTLDRAPRYINEQTL